MSIYIHRCETCGHTNYEHTGNRDHESACRHASGCDCKVGKYGPSILMPTFTGKGEEVDRIIRPGDGIRSQSNQIIIPSCNCDECQALYEAAS